MTPGCDVLVVDDAAVVTDAIRRVLQDEGLEVTTLPNAEAALAHPDLALCRLVICDLMLPGHSGLEALEAMRARRPKLPIVMITGYATPAQEDRILAAGATAFLPKPFDESELLTLVRRVLSPTDVVGKEPKP